MEGRGRERKGSRDGGKVETENIIEEKLIEGKENKWKIDRSLPSILIFLLLLLLLLTF